MGPRLDTRLKPAILSLSTTPQLFPLDMLTLTKNPEVWIVESFETGLCDVYDNPKAAQEHVEEMNKECPDDHYWFYPRPLRSA